MIVGHLRERFIDKATDRPALPLVRLYVTRRSDALEPALQDFARALGPDGYADRNPVCLTLLGTAGEEAAWNDRHVSVGHKAIPLPSVEALQRSPMVAQLVAQLGLNPRHVIDPDPALFRVMAERSYSVFFVNPARDSPYVPAQANFVIPYGIRCVLGFGGVLPDGALYAVLLFSTVAIPSTALDAFAAISLSVKLALLPHVGGPTFDGEFVRPDTPDARGALDRVLLEARATTLARAPQPARRPGRCRGGQD